MRSPAKRSTKSLRIVMITAGILLLAGAALTGCSALGQRGDDATPQALGSAPGTVVAPDTPAATATRTPTPWVVTPRPQPADLFAAATLSTQATVDALRDGTPTATPRNMVTATFTPQPPMSTRTPTPEAAATAQLHDAAATAAAAPGTPAPSPAWAVIATDTPPGSTPLPLLVPLAPEPPPAAPPTPSTTPLLALLVVTQPPPPDGLLAAATVVASAPADARLDSTPAPALRNRVTATVTPRPRVITRTPTPESVAVARLREALATAAAITHGTPTPFPAHVVIATDTPTPAPRPTSTPALLLLPITPAPPPAATPTRPAALPAELIGKILFVSDRGGAQRPYALDPASGQLFAVTENWPVAVARAREGRSPDGAYSVEEQMVTYAAGWDAVNDPLQAGEALVKIFVRDNKSNAARPLADISAWHYDPAWSPTGDRIAFVSQEPGNDEIFTSKADGSDLQRLTTNTWEWDKHPSWSPDGKQIVFYSNRDTGQRQLWVMNADGSNQRRLLDSPSNDWDPIWCKWAN